MATNPVLQDDQSTLAGTGEDVDLSAQENWELIFRMFGSGKEMFAEYGGGEAFLRAERAAWTHEPV